MNDYLACKSVIDLVKDFGKQIIAEEREVDVADDFVELVNRIEKLPKADYTEVKHGEWKTPSEIKIKRYEGRIPIATEYIHCQCSDCKHCFLTLEYKGKSSFKYCPNCGAKMDGERNESEVQGK